MILIPQIMRPRISQSLITNGLIGRWSMDSVDISGTTLADTSGLGNHGTLIDNPAKNAHSPGKGLSFNGTNQHMIAPATGASNYSSMTVTFFAKINATQSVSARIVEKGANNEWTVSVRDLVAGELSFTPRNRHISSDMLAAPYIAGIWAFYACVLNATTLEQFISINNVKVASASPPNITASNDSSAIYVARYGGGGYFGSFSMRDLRIYNRALSSDELTSIYNGVG